MSKETESAPDLTHLLEQSKAALQKGQELGSIGDELARDSISLSLEVQKIDARLRWLTNGVLDQLKLASAIAKSLAQRLFTIQSDVKQWDATREQRSNTLDQVLDKLALQYVPPEFHQLAIDEANVIFKKIDDEIPDMAGTSSSGRLTPQNTVHHKWRTLRDFVDEKGILDAAEAMDEDRLLLDDLLATRVDNPAALEQQISDTRESLLPTLDEIDIGALMNQREASMHEMATRVESLATHYDQLEDALRAVESGTLLHEEDIEVFIHDTNELPIIIKELELSLTTIENVRDTLVDHKDRASELIAKYPEALKFLDDLSSTMTSMVHQQDQLEMELSEFQYKLQAHLEAIDELCATYESYQFSFNVLVLELDRRKQWSVGMITEVKKMKEILAECYATETQRRESFMTTYGSSLPEDLCHSISNQPIAFDIISSSVDGVNSSRSPGVESFPAIPEDILAEAHARVEEARMQET